MSELENQDIQAETAPEVEKVIDQVEEVLEGVDESPAEEPIKGEVAIEWDKADLVNVCGQCGHEEKITEAIGGVTLFMPTRSNVETRLVCSKCDTKMSLVFRNGTMLTDEEKAEARRQYDDARAPKMEVVEDEGPVDETIGNDEPQEESKE
jgi:hypothetical protein